jgi:Tfp pilus assembly protein PilF
VIKIAMTIVLSLYRITAVVILLWFLIPTNVIGQQRAADSQKVMVQADEYLNAGKFTLAISLLDEIIATDSQNVKALTLLGRAYLSAQQFQEAERFFKRALNIDERHVDANLGLAISLMLNGKADEAKKYARLALPGDSTNVDALNILGEITAGEDDIDGARRYYEQILQIDSTHYDALTNLGVLYQRAGSEGQALQCFQKAVKFHPKRSSAYHNLGVLYSVIGQLHEAIVTLNTAASIDSTNPKSVRTLGIVYLRQGLFGEAIKTFQRAIERDFFDIESRVGKTLGYWLLQEYDSVLREINDVASMGIHFNRMELFLANVYFQKKDYERAIEFALEDHKQNPSQAEGHYLLFVLYRLKGEEERSKDEFKEASTIMEKNPKASLFFSINNYFPSTENK